MAEPDISIRDIFPPVAEHCHGSSIVQCPDGSLLACWFQGSGERRATDVAVRGAWKRPGDAEWGEPFLMADTPELPDCNPVLFIDNTDRLWLFWIAVPAEKWECSLLKYRRVKSYAAPEPIDWDWQDVIVLKPGDAFADTMREVFREHRRPAGMWAEYAPPYERMLVEAAQDPSKRQFGWMTRIHPLTLPSGRILLPLYSDGFNVSLVAISDDNGENWRPSRPIVGFGPIQPALVRRNDGTVVAYLRDSGDPPNRVQVSASRDEGESWTFAEDTEIPNPGSSVDMIRLGDGHWLMVCNDTETGRGQLSALLSDDEGQTWKWRRAIEPSGSGGRSFSYPSVIESDRGIEVTYSWAGEGVSCIRHATLTADWVKAKGS